MMIHKTKNISIKPYKFINKHKNRIDFFNAQVFSNFLDICLMVSIVHQRIELFISKYVSMQENKKTLEFEQVVNNFVNGNR